MAVISTKNLTYTYSQNTPFQITGIEDITVDIEEGAFVGVIGHTGSGKSTFVQHLNGLLKPTSGTVFVDGQDIWGDGYKIRDVRFKVGLVFQYPEYQLFEETVRKDIAFGPKNMGLTEQEIGDRVLEAAGIVGIREELLDKSPFDLSGGEKRRVAIAGIVAMRPRVLILDEPCAGLDPRGRERILGSIARFHRETGTTVVIVSHSMDDIARYADKVLVINEHKLFAYDSVENTFAREHELKNMGLSLPDITEIFVRLKARGFDVPTNIYTVEDGMRIVRELLAKGGGADA